MDSNTLEQAIKVAQAEQAGQSGQMDDSTLKSKIANILGIDNSAAWSIIDSDPDNHLYLVHYGETADLNKYGQIRGIVVDEKAQAVVCRSFGYTPTAQTDQLVVSPDGRFHISDIEGMEHVIDANMSPIKMGFEGTVIRVFKHNNKVYRSTHRRLDTSRSRWGSSVPFEQMYYDLGGPIDEELFDAKSAYSPYCHIFLVVHPDVLNVSKTPIGGGYIVYLGPKQLWSFDPTECPYKQTTEEGTPIGEGWDNDPRPNAGWIDNTLYTPTTTTTYPSGTQPELYSPLNLTLNQANQYLRFGNYTPFDDSTIDPRLRLGEFVVLYKLNDQGEISGLLRVQSYSYSWRLEGRNNDPNLKHRLYQLLNASYSPDNYFNSWPMLTPHNVNYIVSIIKQNPILIWPGGSARQAWITNKNERFFNIWMNFLLVVPPHKQLEVALMYPELLQDRNALTNWLLALDESNNLSSLENEGGRRAREIITTAQKLAQQQTNKGTQTQALSVHQLTQQNIRGFISKEYGDSLYRLVRLMKQARLENS